MYEASSDFRDGRKRDQIYRKSLSNRVSAPSSQAIGYCLIYMEPCEGLAVTFHEVTNDDMANLLT